MQYYPTRKPFVKRTVSADTAAQLPTGIHANLTQAEQIKARLEQLRNGAK